MRKLTAAAFSILLLAPGAHAENRWQSLPEPPALSSATRTGFVDVAGARLWYATYGAGPPVILLHGGLADSETWGGQVPALARSHRVVLIDTRGHGRSTRDDVPLTYELLAADVIGVMDNLKIAKADVVGWSDGAMERSWVWSWR
jgi:hypothetical protein